MDTARGVYVPKDGTKRIWDGKARAVVGAIIDGLVAKPSPHFYRSARLKSDPLDPTYPAL